MTKLETIIRDWSLGKSSRLKRMSQLLAVDTLLCLDYQQREDLSLYLNRYVTAKSAKNSRAQGEIIRGILELLFPADFIGKLCQGPMPKRKSR